jgi:uncharacterized membrane protein YkvI
MAKKAEPPKPNIDTVTEYTVRHKTFEEGMKIQFDGIKHLTTLNTGAILIVLTIFEKMFTVRETLIPLLIALCLFILSILISTFVMVLIAAVIRESIDGEFIKSRYPAIRILTSLSYMIFISGLVMLSIGVVMNLRTPKS